MTLSPRPERPLPLGLTRDLQYRVAGAAASVLVILVAMAVRPTPFEGESATVTREDASGGSSSVARPPPARGSARELRTRFSKQVKGGKWGDAASTLESLAAADPRAPEDEAVHRDIHELAARAPDEPAERVFGLLATKMGSTGIDLLYEMYTSRSGSKSAERAKATLADESVRKRGTPAMRVAYDLVRAKSCKDKAALIERAGEEGDERALGRLRRISRECDLEDEEKLDEAIEAIAERAR